MFSFVYLNGFRSGRGRSRDRGARLVFRPLIGSVAQLPPAE